MTLYTYTGFDQQGAERTGTIEAVNTDLAINALQRRGLIISKIEEPKTAGFDLRLSLFDRIKNEDIVMTSRQITTLFEAQVSALRAFKLLAAEARTPKLADVLSQIANDIQSGSSIAAALQKHPTVFSNFYVNMVRAGEESGKLDETFSFLADHLDRNYELSQKAKNALIYPAFIILTFVSVMILMMTVVVPHLSEMLNQVGQNVPLFTRIIIGLSEFMARYILLLLIAVLIGGVTLYQYGQTTAGKLMFARARLDFPAVGNIYRKIFLSRISDNLSTMLKSGIPQRFKIDT
jgi:type II secretory pathway component PulF